MVLEFFHFDYSPARNKLRSRSQSVSQAGRQSEKKSLHIMYAALATPFGRRALRARLPKNGVAAPAASTIIFDAQNTRCTTSIIFYNGCTQQ